MEMIKKKRDRKIWLENYIEGQDISFPFKKQPFVYMIWNNKENFISLSLIKELIKAKCKYFVAGGFNCENQIFPMMNL